MAWYRCGMNATYNATTVSRSGAVCNYVANVGGVPLSRFIANITPIQAGSGDPSPSNPRAITGWSAVNVVRTGKNLLPVTLTSGTDTGIEYTVNADGTIKAYGRSTALRNVNIGSMNLPAGTYFLNGCVGGSTDTYRLQVLKGGANLGLDTGSGVEFTLTETANVVVRIQIRANNLDVDTTFSPMVKIGSTPSTYAPYTGQTATINLGGTYYLATLNVLTGLLTVLGLLTTYDKNSSWTRNTSGIFYTNAPSGIEDLYISNMFECYLPKGSSNALADGQCRLNAVSTFINFKVTSCDTVDDFKAFLGDNTIQMVYTLATPQTYQLTPAQLTQLLGENNVWCDSGDSEVDFFKIIRT